MSNLKNAYNNTCKIMWCRLNYHDAGRWVGIWAHAWHHSTPASRSPGRRLDVCPSIFLHISGWNPGRLVMGLLKLEWIIINAFAVSVLPKLQLTSTTICSYKPSWYLQQCYNRVVTNWPEKVDHITDKAPKTATGTICWWRIENVLSKVIADYGRRSRFACVNWRPTFPYVQLFLHSNLQVPLMSLQHIAAYRYILYTS